jgi:hypothetical protein
MIDILSADMSDAVEMNVDADTLDGTIQWKLRSIVFKIVQQCSSKIFQVYIYNLLLNKFKLSNI